MQIFVFGIGMSLRQNLSKGRSGFKSSLIHEHNSKHILFVSTIDNDLNYLLEIYQEFQLIKCIKGRTPDEVWYPISIKNFTSTQLFGLDNSTTQLYINQHKFFINWAQNENETIELVTSLQKIYLTHYQFSEREFSVWKTLIRAQMDLILLYSYPTNQ
ncbi:6915_t:CDS:2, partial [Scutellospora calospora]